MRYSIFEYNGEREVFVKTIDDSECDVQERLKELNREYTDEERIHGLGYFLVKQRIINNKTNFS